MDQQQGGKKLLFLAKNPENGDFNQYWYSTKTIQYLVERVQAQGKTCAFLSTPSIFYSLDVEFRKNCYLFEFDKKFEKNNPNFVFYDFKQPQDIPEKLNQFFDFVLIDPPFITRDVWELYAKATKQIIKSDGKILLSSIDENQEMLKELLGVDKKSYRPSIPNLVYQYSFYANYQDSELDKVNEEIGF